MERVCSYALMMKSPIRWRGIWREKGDCVGSISFSCRIFVMQGGGVV